MLTFLHIRTSWNKTSWKPFLPFGIGWKTPYVEKFHAVIYAILPSAVIYCFKDRVIKIISEKGFAAKGN